MIAENEPAKDGPAPLIPLELRAGLRRRALGYDTGAVDRLTAAMSERYEQMWRENAELRARVRRLELELAHHTAEEREAREALISAHSAAEALRRQATADAERKTQAAEERVRQTIEGAGLKRRELEAEVQQLESVGKEIRAGYQAFLLAALELVEGAAGQLEPGALGGVELSAAGEHAVVDAAPRPAVVSSREA